MSSEGDGSSRSLMNFVMKEMNWKRISAFAIALFWIVIQRLLNAEAVVREAVESYEKV